MKFKVGDIILLSNPDDVDINSEWINDNPLCIGRIIYISDMEKLRPYNILVEDYKGRTLACNEEELTIVEENKNGNTKDN